MKLGFFFLLSLILHVAILSLPGSLTETTGERAYPVILLVERGIKQSRRQPESRNVPGDEKKLQGPVEKLVETRAPEQRAESPAQASRESNLPHPIDAPSNATTKAIREQKPSEDGPTLAKAHEITRHSLAGGPQDGRKKLKPVEKNRGTNGSNAGTQQSNDTRPPLIFSRVKYAYNPAPEYPESARREGSEGMVLLAVLVDREGRPEKIEVSRSSGFKALDQAASNTVKSWRFHPARQGEEPVQSWVTIPIVFRLTTEQHAAESSTR